METDRLLSKYLSCAAVIKTANRNEYMKNYMANRYHSKRNSIINSLGGECKGCGSKDNLHIDHIDSKKKTFRAADLHSVSDSALQEELKNFQLLCNDCHKAKTKESWDFGVPKPEHGKYWTFRAHGCRCDECTKAYKDKIQEWKNK